MNIRILDLDGGVTDQANLIHSCQPRVTSARAWGPDLRLACSFRRFQRFERWLTREWQDPDGERQITFVGSGDFHHVSLALVGRLRTPLNLLVIDNHPDWMRGIPFLHCGTWLYHAARLPFVNKVFHVGGDVDFDNYYQGMAPWGMLNSGKIVVIPGIRSFQRGRWSAVPNLALLQQAGAALTAGRMDDLISAHADDLARYPLYISLDKDVMTAKESIVNWDSGHLKLADVLQVLRSFQAAAGFRVAGMDIVGDWSAVNRRGWLRHLMHYIMHPAIKIDPNEAATRNAETNLAILDCVHQQQPARTHALAS